MKQVSQVAPSNPAPNSLHPSAARGSSRAAIIGIAILAVVLGFLAGRFNPLLFNSASVEGGQVDTLFSVLLGIATTIFVIVQGGLLYSIIRFRRQPGDETEGEFTHGHTGLEILWTAIPAVLVTSISIYSYSVLVGIERPAPDAIAIEVTGRQFQWQFYYPDQDLQTTELHVPIGRQIYVKLHSADVIHSFWIPAFRVKKDAMPDRVTELRFTPDKDGMYPIVCSRICGVGHAAMRANLVVQEPAEFEAWLKEQTGTTAQVPADPIVLGRQMFQKNGCGACHMLADAGGAGTAGPTLTHIGTQAGNMVPGQSADQYIHESIVNPNAFIVPGFQSNIMPKDFGQRLSDQELQALVQYLLAQK